MRRFNLLLFTGVIGTALCASFALALPASHFDSRQTGVNGALSGNWVGNVLPPGISPFEVIRSTVTFRPDGTFQVVAEKPTGSFRGAGTYSVQGSTAALSFPSTAPVYYRLTRSRDKFHFQLLQGVQPSLLSLSLTDRSKLPRIAPAVKPMTAN